MTCIYKGTCMGSCLSPLAYKTTYMKVTSAKVPVMFVASYNRNL